MIAFNGHRGRESGSVRIFLGFWYVYSVLARRSGKDTKSYYLQKLHFFYNLQKNLFASSLSIFDLWFNGGKKMLLARQR